MKPIHCPLIIPDRKALFSGGKGVALGLPLDSHEIPSVLGKKIDTHTPKMNECPLKKDHFILTGIESLTPTIHFFGKNIVSFQEGVPIYPRA